MAKQHLKLFLIATFLSKLVHSKHSTDRSPFDDDNDLVDFGRLLIDLIAKTKPGHCYVFVTDSIYQVVLTDRLFREIENHPRYVVQIPDYEDTLDPAPRVRCMFEEVRKIGCGAYVILLANGIQMERLLRFGDRTRIINTRAKFIILHDYRLFVPDLHYLWKRIVNVVFVRQLVIDRSRNKDEGHHYELSTVPFPFPLRGVFISRRLDFWFNGKFRKGRKLFTDRTTNLDGQSMKVVVLAHTPAIFRTTHNETDEHLKYYGLEVELLKAVSEAMKFEMDFYETDDAAVAMWGKVTDGENSTGLLGEMNEGRADFALADLHHTQYHLEIMDLSIPYNTECLTFLTPEALTDNSWTTLILPFTGGMWAGVLASLFSIGSVFYALSRLLMYVRHEQSFSSDLDMIAKRCGRRKRKVQFKKWYGLMNTYKRKLGKWKWMKLRKKPKDAPDMSKLKMLKMIPFKRQPLPWKDPLPPRDIFDTFSGCIIYTYSMLLLVSLPRLPKGWPLRLLTGWYWIYCILLVVAYRASLTAILANPVARVTIDKLKDLADSPIRCGAWGEQNKLFFQTASDQASMQIGQKLEHTPKAESAVERVVEGHFAYYDNVYMLKHLRATQKSAKARETLHIMEECAVHMPISIGMEKNSPLKPKVDKYVRALVEAGLTKKWLADAIEEFQSNVELPPQEATIDLQKLTAAFIALAIGYGVSLLAFGAEKLYWRCVIEKHPAYDKYIVGSYRGKVVKF
ncbi:glutamate receptor 2 [Aedes albopictus]|uniref:Ionotropic glutamate receptor L-glutamate and glycine-binding domain-containing protein n=1 Tax=Aedes albopictus TaxID=7160 RepID=A0ABM1Y7C4_AEDAL